MPQGSRWTEMNQGAQFVENLIGVIADNWKNVEPLLIDENRKQILQNLAGPVGRILSDTDRRTGESIYPYIRGWIQRQSPSRPWRQIPINGRIVHAPGDEDTIVAIAMGSCFTFDISGQISKEQEQEILNNIARFLGAIEKAAERGVFRYEDWVQTIDHLSHNPVQEALRDIFATLIFHSKGFYGFLQSKLDDTFAIKQIPNQALANLADRLEAQCREPLPHTQLFQKIGRGIRRLF